MGDLLEKLGIGAFKQRLPRAGEALPGRDVPLPLHGVHYVNGRPLQGDFPGMETLDVGMGCFWGAERKFWPLPGVFVTAVGYQGGQTPNPTYEEVCSGLTGHNEVVRVVYDPTQVSYESSCCAPSGNPTTRPRACARATISARSIARASM